MLIEHLGGKFLMSCLKREVGTRGKGKGVTFIIILLKLWLGAPRERKEKQVKDSSLGNILCSKNWSRKKSHEGNKRLVGKTGTENQEIFGSQEESFKKDDGQRFKCFRDMNNRNEDCKTATYLLTFNNLNMFASF